MRGFEAEVDRVICPSTVTGLCCAVGCVHIEASPKRNSRFTWDSLSLFTTCESGAKRCWARSLSYSSQKTPESNKSVNSLHRSSSMKKPLRGGKKRTAIWVSHHEERGSDDVVAPPVGDPRVVPHRWVVFARCNPSGAAAAAGHDAAARVRGAARAADDGVVDVPQALQGSASASPITAQRVARFDS